MTIHGDRSWQSSSSYLKHNTSVILLLKIIVNIISYAVLTVAFSKGRTCDFKKVNKVLRWFVTGLGLRQVTGRCATGGSVAADTALLDRIVSTCSVCKFSTKFIGSRRELVASSIYTIDPGTVVVRRRRHR